jgi:aryl-alcohol dehydrogenase-like predicted oxidoreductase
MEYRQLGQAGVRVSALGLGTNQFGGPLDQNGVNEIVAAALDMGINFIDTANVYQKGRSEETLGVALRGRRERVVLATKGFFATGDGPNDRGASRYHLVQAVDASLRRLQTDHIDLYQMHRWDENTPIEETLRALDDLVRAGKILYLGASAYASWQLARANLTAEIHGWSPFVTVQSHYHMLERQVEDEVLPYCRAYNVGFIPFFPLAGGFLTGKYRRGEPAPEGSRGQGSQYVQAYMTDANFDRVKQLTAWAEAREHSMAELAQAWLMAQPQVCSVISGLTKLSHLQSNVRSVEWQLSAAELKEIRAILES